MMIFESITVRRRYWHTIHDHKAGRPERVRHDAILRFAGGIELRTARLSTAMAQRLLDAGTELDEGTPPHG